MTNSKNKPALFIGSSTQSLPVARVLQSQLKADATVNVWDQGIFGISDYTLDRLLGAIREFDFGVFVFSADDTLEIQGQRYLVARDNVVFELGVFAGGLGRERTFMVVQELLEPFHLPTDPQGITTARSSWSRDVLFESDYVK